MWGVKQFVIFSVVLLINLPGCAEAGGGAAGGPVVLMATSQGEVKIELFQKGSAGNGYKLPRLRQRRIL